MNEASKAAELTATTRTALAEGTSAAILRRQLFGKEGQFSELLKGISQLPVEDRPHIQTILRTARQELESMLTEPVAEALAREPFDTSVPPAIPVLGTIHPISQMIETMVEIFSRLSFEVVEGPEIVGELENFEWLNIGPNHPARDGHKSLYIDKSHLLRTQTTAVQVLEMRARQKQGKLPIRIVVPGKTYRHESDPTHSPMFHQIDAVVVDQQTSFSDLRGSLNYLVQELFGTAVETRFRPHHFPFTEPSAELDIRWRQDGDERGKHTEWLEMGGCGMIHPAVLRRAGINPEQYRGWAFGMSIERPIMVKYGVNDLRKFYENSLPFLTQFPIL